MKKLRDYIWECTKEYKFKIRLACECDPAELKKSLSEVLDKFKVINLSNGTRTPIQEVPLDFPNLQNTSVVCFEVSLQYPSISSVLEEHISYCLSIPRTNIRVKTDNDPIEELQDIILKQEKSLLNIDDACQDGQKLVGQNRISDLLKELNKNA